MDVHLCTSPSKCEAMASCRANPVGSYTSTDAAKIRSVTISTKLCAVEWRPPLVWFGSDARNASIVAAGTSHQWPSQPKCPWCPLTDHIGRWSRHANNTQSKSQNVIKMKYHNDFANIHLSLLLRTSFHIRFIFFSSSSFIIVCLFVYSSSVNRDILIVIQTKMKEEEEKNSQQKNLMFCFAIHSHWNKFYIYSELTLAWQLIIWFRLWATLNFA